MAGFSQHLGQGLINHVFRSSAFSMPVGVYLALAVSDPGDTTAGALNAEISALSGWYVRQAATPFNAPTLSGTDVYTSNASQINFPAVTGVAVTVTHWMLFDAASAGNLLASGALNATRTLNVSDVLVFSAGSLVLTFQ